MKKRWYEIKERSAGIKRLRLTWYIYRFLGRKPVELIAMWVGFFTLLASKILRNHSRIYFETLYKYTGDKAYKPSFLNSLKHIQSYALSLVDKMEVYASTATPKFLINNSELKRDLSKGGIFFIFNHTGNIELMRAFLKDNNHKKVNIFMQRAHCEKFNDFINSLSETRDVTVFPVEDIGIATAIDLKSRLEQGEIVFMAGDRLSAQNTNKCYNVSLLGRDVRLPLGTLKFGLLMDSPIYLIACIKNKNNEFEINAEKFHRDESRSDNLSRLQVQFSDFLQRITLSAPYQFYNFYDFFE